MPQVWTYGRPSGNATFGLRAGETGVLSANACLHHQSVLRIIHIEVENLLMAANLLDALADYVKVLSASMEKTTRAEDRSAYIDRPRFVRRQLHRLLTLSQ